MSERIRQALGRLLACEQDPRLHRPVEGHPRVAVLYPNVYSAGMANLGLHAVLELLTRHGASWERFFLPPPQLQAEHHRSSVPLLSLESGRPLPRFDLVLASISFEPDYVGLATMLRLGGLAPLAAERREQDPPVVAGGMAPTLNPEPVAPLCDLIGIGEAESLLPALLELLREGKGPLLEQAARLPGWYAPAADPDAAVTRQAAETAAPVLPMVLSSRSAFARHVDVEVSRGCLWRCRFCAAGHVITPHREHDADRLAGALSWAVARRGRVGLVGTDVSDHRDLLGIAESVWRLGGELALPSLRVEAVAHPDGPASTILARQPPRTLTMAVEAATDSLRCALGKRLSDARIRQAARVARDAGVAGLRVYLLVGTPGETDDDLDAVAELCRGLRADGPGGALTLSVNGLVPKPGTPLQWEPAPGRETLRRARRRLRQALPLDRLDVAFESPDWSRWQCLLALGSRDTSRHVLHAADHGWRAALAAAQHEGEPTLTGAGRAPGAPLPWDHVHDRSRAGCLVQERRRFRERIYTPPIKICDGAAPR